MKEQTISQEGIELRRQYYREYRKANRERIRKINARYWEKKAREQQQEQQEKNVG